MKRKKAAPLGDQTLRNRVEKSRCRGAIEGRAVFWDVNEFPRNLPDKRIRRLSAQVAFSPAARSAQILVPEKLRANFPPMSAMRHAVPLCLNGAQVHFPVWRFQRRNFFEECDFSAADSHEAVIQRPQAKTSTETSRQPLSSAEIWVWSAMSTTRRSQESFIKDPPASAQDSKAATGCRASPIPRSISLRRRSRFCGGDAGHDLRSGQQNAGRPIGTYRHQGKQAAGILRDVNPPMSGGAVSVVPETVRSHLAC